MPAALQTRLLRVLSDGTFYRVGGHAPQRADVRVLAATHQDLEAKVREGSFAKTSFIASMSSACTCRLCASAARTSRAFARHFLLESAIKLEVERKILSPAAEAVFTAWNWPGNVRQLEMSAAGSRSWLRRQRCR